MTIFFAFCDTTATCLYSRSLEFNLLPQVHQLNMPLHQHLMLCLYLMAYPMTKQHVSSIFLPSLSCWLFNPACMLALLAFYSRPFQTAETYFLSYLLSKSTFSLSTFNDSANNTFPLSSPFFSIISFLHTSEETSSPSLLFLFLVYLFPSYNSNIMCGRYIV